MKKLGLYIYLQLKLRKYLHRNSYNEELTISYEKTKEEPPKVDILDPNVVLFSPLSYFPLTYQKSLLLKGGNIIIA